jgi:DNA-binding NtrC family response regulator
MDQRQVETDRAAVMARHVTLKAMPKVLIVDDERGMAKVIAATACGLGFETREVNDARLARAGFIEFRPDVLILDLIMPEKDGLDVLNEVLVIDPWVRVVLISGHGEGYLRLGEAFTRFHRDGGAEILRKPFRAEALREALRRSVEMV